MLTNRTNYFEIGLTDSNPGPQIMHCQNCMFDLKQLTCGHNACSKCLELAINLRDFWDGARSENWCPQCETEDLEKLGKALEAKMNSIFKGVEQKKEELRVAAESREQIIETIVSLRTSVEALLRQKELQVMETLDESYDELQTMASDGICKAEEELEAIDRCWKALPKISTRNPEKSEMPLSNGSSTCLDDITGLTPDPLSECYSLKLEPDERFFQTLSKLVSFPMGRASLVTGEDCSDQSFWFGQELPLDITSEEISESFQSFHSCYLKPGGSSKKSFFLAVDAEGNAKTPLSSMNADCGSESEKCRLSSEVSMNSKCSTPLSPPTSDSGNSSIFTFPGQENASDIQAPVNCKRRCKSLTLDSSYSASKFMRSASNKIRSFLQNLRRPNTRKKLMSGKRLMNYHTPSDQKSLSQWFLSPDSSSSDSSVVHRKKLFPAVETETISSLALPLPEIRIPPLSPTLNCAVLGSLRPQNADSDFNLPEISMTSVSDSPTKLFEFSCLTDGERSCWLIDIVFLPDEKHIVVFDAVNQNLKKFETLTGELASILRLSSEKSNLSVLSSIFLAVTLPETKQICFVEYLDQLTVSRKTSTSKVYMGIASLGEDRLVCASLDRCIDVLTLNCEILASFSKENLNIDAPFFPTYLTATPGGKVLISDRIKRGLICLNVDESCVDFCYYGQEDLAITWPAGVACDRQGNIYLADCFKTNIHRLSPTGEFDRLFMSEADNIKMCRGMDISCNGQLVLTEYRHKTIKVFSL